jgi:hypothetical protein
MILVTLGLATSAFLWLTMRTTVDQVDGPLLNVYGFPFPFFRWSQVSSLHYHMDVVFMMVDYGVYVGVLALTLTVQRVRSGMAQMPRWAVAIPVCIAVLSASLFGAGALAGGYHAVPYSPAGSVVDRMLHVGPHFPY